MNSSFENALLNFQNRLFADAEQQCSSALEAEPDNANAHHLMGAILSAEQRPDSALEHFEKALDLAPSMTEARFNLGKTYRDLGRHDDASLTFISVSNEWPARSDVWLELAIALERTGRLSEAIAAYERTVETGAPNSKVWYQLGCCCMANNSFEKADHAFNQSLVLDPIYAPAWINLAVTRENRKELASSIEIYAALLNREPQYHEAAYRHALGLLTTGNLEAGWEAYASRGPWPQTKTSHGSSDAPFWSGEDLTGKSLLIWTEQGPGDEILMGTMFGDLLHSGAHITLACSARVAPLFMRSFPSCQVIVRGDTQLPEQATRGFELQASLTEVGLNTRQNLDSFGASSPYLVTDAKRTQGLRSNYTDGQGTRPTIGISWRSNNDAAGHQKSTKLLDWGDTLKSIDAHFVCLQYGDTDEELSVFKDQMGIEIFKDHDIDPLSDMDAFASQVAATDLVISTSNTTVHVAGAIGVDVFTLVPDGTGQPWYWFLDRSDCLWYPSMKLFRQPNAGNWATPLSVVRKNLEDWILNWPGPK
jgi:Flp pilus assembly protein TadD